MPRLSSHTTALEVARSIDLSGKLALVTGASSGIGTETARALAAAGAEVIMPTRDLEFGCAVADRLITDTGNTKIRNYEMDLADFDSVRRFADNVMTEYGQLDILINNAGIMACPQQRCPQGFELQFSVNHLGHFLLTAMLSPCLAASPSCRVVSLSAPEHRLAPLVFEDLHFEQRHYDKWLAYAQSKTATALFALELNERLMPGGSALAVSPARAMTNLQRHLALQEIQTRGWMNEAGHICKNFKTPAQAAAMLVWAATSSEAAALGGTYCEDTGRAEPAADAQTGVAAHACDREAAARLWELSEHLVDQPFPCRSTLPSTGTFA